MIKITFQVESKRVKPEEPNENVASSSSHSSKSKKRSSKKKEHICKHSCHNDEETLLQMASTLQESRLVQLQLMEVQREANNAQKSFQDNFLKLFEHMVNK